MSYLALLVVALCYSFGAVFGISIIVRLIPGVKTTNVQIFVPAIVTALLIAAGIYYTTHPVFN